MADERAIMTNVLELYKEMRYLWDKNSKDYMNKTMRNEGYNVLVNIYKNFDQNATVKTFKKKMDNLKTNYFRELKKVKASKGTGAGTANIYVPTIWYYDHFSFLASTSTPSRSGLDSMENNEGSSCEEDYLPPTKIGGTSVNPAKKKKKESPVELQKSILEKASTLMEAKDNDWEILGRCIGMQLRDLSMDQQTIARKLISDVIYYGTLKKLNENWCVTSSQYSSCSPHVFLPTPHRSPSPQYHTQFSSNQSQHNHMLSTHRQIPSPHPTPSLHGYSRYSQQQFSRSSSPYYQNISASNSPHTVPSPQYTPSPHPSPSPQNYTTSASNSPLHAISSTQQQFLQSSSPYYHNISTSNSPHTLQSTQLIKSPCASPSHHEYILSSSNSIPSPQEQFPHHSLTLSHAFISNSPHTLPSPRTIQSPSHMPDPSAVIQIHIPEQTPEQTSDHTPTLVEGSGDMMKNFLIFKKK